MELQLRVESMTLLSPVEVLVYLPDNYLLLPDLKVVYCLHPACADGRIFAQRLGLHAIMAKKPFAAAAPSLGNHFYLDQPSGRYFEFLHTELRPLLQHVLQINSDPAHNLLLGISMGAFGALNWALNGRDTFAKAALLSGFYRYKPEEYAAGSRRSRLLRNLVMPFYESSQLRSDGSLRFDVEQEIEASARQHDTAFRLYYGEADKAIGLQSQAVYAKLRACGFTADIFEVPGDHDENCWQQTLPQAFDWLLADNELCS